MQAMSGVATDYNIGSQIRTAAESQGAVVEMQSVAAQQQAYYGLTYGSISAFGITPLGPQVAAGYVTFSTTSSGTPVPATQSITIPPGTLLQTAGGIQFQTSVAATLVAGSTSVTVAVQAIVGGTTGNVGAGQITQIITGLGYALYVTNTTATSGGAAAETPSATLSRFAAAVGALGQTSPYAVANAAIGVTNGAEVVKYAACFEPWILCGVASGQLGFTLYIDNGTGGASAQLIANVVTKLTGNQSQAMPGYRPVGVPFSVQAVTPIYANVMVTGSLLQYIQSSAVETNISAAISQYFAQQGINGSAYQANLSASVGNAGEGYFTALTVGLYFASGGSAVTSITAGYGQRIIPQTITQNITTTTA